MQHNQIQAGKKPPKAATFLVKTFNMVSDVSTDDIICWNDNGDEFIVKKEHEFSQTVLPQHFRSRNFSSFVRQLNFYGFHKKSIQSNYAHFTHECFRRGHPELLGNIKRKTTESQTQVKEQIADLQQQVAQLKKQYEEFGAQQNKILYFLTHLFMRANKSRGLGASQGRMPGTLRSNAPNKRPRLLLESGAHFEPPPQPEEDDIFNVGTFQQLDDLRSMINSLPSMPTEQLSTEWDVDSKGNRLLPAKNPLSPTATFLESPLSLSSSSYIPPSNDLALHNSALEPHLNYNPGMAMSGPGTELLDNSNPFPSETDGQIQLPDTFSNFPAKPELGSNFFQISGPTAFPDLPM